LKLLTIHAEKFWFKAREKALRDAEDLSNVPGEAKMENALVAFISVEEGDAKGGKEFLEQVAKNIVEIAENVKAEAIVLYPYAHLSSDLAPPFEAMDVLRMLENVVKSSFKGQVLRAPFGWYKAFEIKCLGHPLSELSRELKPSTTKRLTIEKEYFILTPSGELYRPEEYKFRDDEEGLKILVDKEYFKKELPGGKPRIVEICKKFGFEWEPMSDAGHMRYGPHATTILGRNTAGSTWPRSSPSVSFWPKG
jgi:threonyl-tRNA synthetase